MALLTERQRTADALMRELHRLGAWVVSPLPLRDDAQLTFHVLDTDRSQILQKLSEWGWGTCTLAGSTPRITNRGMEAATVYQLDLPRDRQLVADDRVKAVGVSDDSNRREKTPAEVEAIRKYLGWKT
jgi:hypothetical protein